MTPKTIGGIVGGVVGGILLVGAIALFFVLRSRPKLEPSTPTEFPHYSTKNFGKLEKIERKIRPEEQVIPDPYVGSHLKIPIRKEA